MGPALAEFFISCALGLEEELAREVGEVLPFLIDTRGRPQTVGLPEFVLHKGGLSLEMPEELGFQMNAWLKLANRILLRLSKFPAKSPTRLHERLKSVDIKSYLGEQVFELQIDTHECAVHNEKWIHRLATDFWPLADKADQRQFLRGDKDEWVLSLDTSGEHLHKRGDRPRAGAAPLRETLVAATLRLMLKEESRAGLAEVALLDPMAGSGSFLREARNLYLPNLQRTYAFQSFGRLPKIMKSESFWKNLREPWREEPLFGDLIGGEIDESVYSILAASPGIRAYPGDSLQRLTRVEWGLPPDQRLWIVLNPPYGERIKDLSWMGAFPAWLKSMAPEKLALWLPVGLERSFVQQLGVTPASSISLSNGGIPCKVLLFKFGELNFE